MKKGKIRITKQFLHDSLQFPFNWDIKEVSSGADEFYIEMAIEGNDFPEVENGIVKGCSVWIHKEITKKRFEVKTDG